MRWPSGPGQGGASRPGSSRPSFTHLTSRRPVFSVIRWRYYLIGQRIIERASVKAHCRRIALVTLAILVGVAVAPLDAQYFGRNKVQYRSFKFEILKTEHFDLYHYPEEVEAAK